MIILKAENKNYRCGGKANNLFILKGLGFNVPAFVVIPAEVCGEIVAANPEAKTAIALYEVPSAFIGEIVNSLPATCYYSVRSSAIDEDGGEHSFAGQFESYLYVTKEQLAEKIKQVWLSAFSERVVEYRRNNQLDAGKGIAVIVQGMVNADTAGVAFGINPVTGNRGEKVISSVYGLGEGLVSGELDADTYTVKADASIERNIVAKTQRIALDPDSGKGTVKTEVVKDLQDKSSLNDKQLMDIAHTLDLLFKHYKRYQDIEFAFSGETLYLLQSRPITTLNRLPDPNGEFTIWDNSNIIESYPGVTTPLTFSFILPVYEAVYRQFCGMMGVSQKEIDENKEVFGNMLGLINGRVYYNLLSWYKALALLPGYSINAGFMEKMMGVKERFELKHLKPRNKFRERLRVLNMLRILVKNLRALPKMRTDFVRDFNLKLDEFKQIDYSKKTSDELMYLYLDFEQTLLKKWKAPLVNDFFAMIYFGVLQKMIVNYGIDANGTAQNDLMCGARDIISTEPMHRCVKIATLVAQNTKLSNTFKQQSAEDIYALHLTKKFPTELSNEIDAYIQRFGNRCVGELKLETITYLQDPAAFIRIIKSYVEQGVTSRDLHADLDLQLRKDAEEKAKKALSGKPLKRLLFNYFLKRARILVSSRENLRYERTRAFGVVRELFCTIGDKFCAEGLTEHSRDIFYLSKNEIFDYIKGTSINYDLKALIAMRKTQFLAYEKNTTSERIATKGIVYQGNDFFQKRMTGEVQGDLKGLGCCPGIVKAKVQVVLDPNQVKNLNGDILVTSSTDPGWVTLFPTASGILVERGSLLSHSAIVSREMGKPCIVGITGLLERLKTGDEVEMDGSTGHVRILNNSRDHG